MSFVIITLLYCIASQTITTLSTTPFIISPTLTNASGQYWIATNNNDFEYGYIICQTGDCYINCNTAYSCRYTQIVCNSTTTKCIIHCDDNQSCYSSNITSISSKYTDLTCNGVESCSGLSTISISSSIIDLNCMNQKSCSSSKFNLISNNDHITNITITCSNTDISTSNIYSSCGDTYFNTYSIHSVNIKCNNYDCYSAKFNVSDIISEINMECNSDYSCYEAIIEANIANKLSLRCNGESACKYVITYCPTNNINSCSIYCTNKYDSSCEGMDIYAINYNGNGYNDNFLDLICDTDDAGYDGINSCYQLEIFCDLNSILSSYIGLSEETGKYQCEDVECCPLNTKTQNITCGKGYDCNIKCNDNSNNNAITINTNTCSNKIIDGTQASSLHIMCLSEEIGGRSCNGTTIYCPVINQDENNNITTNCIIKCMEQYSCAYTIIYGGKKFKNQNGLYTFNMSCSSDYNSCFNSKVYVYNADIFNLITGYQSEQDFILYGAMNPVQDMVIYTEDTMDINIKCNMYYGCYRLSIVTNKAHNVKIDCKYSGSCNDTYINVSISSVVELKCDTKYSCLAMYIDINRADVVNIDALKQYALTNSTIHGTECDSFTIYCVSNAKSACNDLNIYIPSSLVDIDVFDNVLFCENYGCGNFDIYAMNGMRDLNVEIDSNCNCNNVYDCISSWNLYCGNIDDKYRNMSIFNGKTCDDGICCDNIVREAEISYAEYCDNYTLPNTTAIIGGITERLSVIKILIYTGSLIGILICCCCTIYTIISYRRKRKYKDLNININNNSGYSNFMNPFITKITRRQKNISIMSQYTRMSAESTIDYEPPPQNNRLFSTPSDGEALSEDTENEALTEMFGGVKSLKPYQLDPNKRPFTITASPSPDLNE